jgi:histidine triad (HIT) family protein
MHNACAGKKMGDDKTTFWEPCWACRVIAGEPVGCVVTETEQVLVLINPFSLSAGHTLIVPRRHIKNLYELPDELAGPILSTAASVARAAKRAFEADGVTLRQNNEAASDQHLFHFHLHVIPRFAGDLERFNASPQLAGIAEQEAWASRLRLAIEPQ